MSESRNRDDIKGVDPRLEDQLERVDQDLDIMERHASEVAETEEDIQSYMKRRDREYKDSHLHSIPKPRKHT